MDSLIFNSSRILSSDAHPAQHLSFTCSFLSSSNCTSFTNCSCQETQVARHWSKKQLWICVQYCCNHNMEWGWAVVYILWEPLMLIQKVWISFFIHDCDSFLTRCLGKLKLCKAMAPDILTEVGIFKKFLQTCTALTTLLPSVVDRLWDLESPRQIWLVGLYVVVFRFFYVKYAQFPCGRKKNTWQT